MKRLVGFLIAISLILVLNILPASSHTADEPFVTDLVAGQTMDAGDILVWNDEANLYVKYVTTGPWCITETHLHVAAALGDIPQTKKGNPKPGKFAYKDSFNPCGTEALYTIPLELDPDTVLYIAAHAIAKNGGKSEAAWAEGSRFPWKSWATYFNYTVQGTTENAPSIEIEKYTNGENADTPPGPAIFIGQTVTWTYEVSNTGNVALENVTVTDDKSVPVSCPKTTLAQGESMTCTASGTAEAGQYTNVGTVTGTSAPGGNIVTDTDTSHYIGVQQGPAITIKKYTYGEDADTPPGPTVSVGATVAWTYVVTNTGNVALNNVAVTDDKGVTVACPGTALDPSQSMTCTASGIAVEGSYENKGTATGTPSGGNAVTADDLSHYTGEKTAIVIGEISASPNVLWPPNHKMVPVAISVTFSGNGMATSTCEIFSVASNERENGLGDGDTSPDWEFTGSSLNLRAERGEAGRGRIYTITVQCTDASTNATQGTVEVTVPHDKGKKK